MISLLREIELQKTALLPPLVNDYLSAKDSIRRLYKYPLALSSFGEVIRDKAKDNTDRKLLVEVLKEQYSYIETTAQVTKNIEALLSPKTFTVTSSHQPCLFMGPLFNIFKIASTINLAAQLKKAYRDYQFVPVFWLGSEDHDVEELNHVNVSGKKTEWKNPGTGPIGRLSTESLKPLVEELRTLGINDEVILMMENGLRKNGSFGRFSQYLVNEIFKHQGLVVLDQDNAKLKKSFAEIMTDEMLNSTGLSVLQPNIEFLEKHYKAQARPREINLFYLGKGFRERIFHNALTQRFEVKNRLVSFNEEELLAEINEHPESFSPNVIYRPLYQEMVLPNLAFVGGPGELNYWLELEPLFDHYQINYPMLLMRHAGAIVNSSFEKKLEKLNLKVDYLFGDIEKIVNDYVSKNLTVDISLNEEKKTLEEAFNAVSLKAEAVDATLRQNVAAEKQKALNALENLEAKMLKAEKRKQEVAVGQIRSLHNALFPEGEPQERIENFLPFWTDDFFEEIVKQADPFSKNFRILIAR